MKWLRSHIAILSSFIFLLAGTGLSFLQTIEMSSHFLPPPESDIKTEKNLSFSPENTITLQPVHQHWFTGCNAYGMDNMMAEIPPASVVNSLQPSASGISPVSLGTDVLNNLVHRYSLVLPFRIRQLHFRSFVKKVALLPMAGGVAIGAP